ncbi:MAG: hypothetical protein ACK4YP_24380 [Myxococcota bacterium]
MRIFRLLGALGSLPLAPVFGLGSLVRRARVFHPVGTCWTARVTPAEGVPPAFTEVARRLSGPARVRCSGGAWKARDAPRDILGVAVRFGESWTTPGDEEVDLLFATFRTLPALPFALFTSDGRDFFANTYWAVVPFRLGGARARLRCVPARPSPGGGDREDILRRSVDGRPTFRIEALVAGDTVARDAVPLVDVTLAEEVPDRADLRFAPWRGARGVEPVGFVTGLRRWSYPGSQATRRLLGR